MLSENLLSANKTAEMPKNPRGNLENKHMKKDGTLAQLLTGSRNIDKMKKRVHETIWLLITLVGERRINPESQLGKDHRKMIPTGTGHWWQLWNGMHHGPGNHEIVVSYFTHDMDKGRGPQYESKNPNGLDQVPMGYVQVMYENLDSLLDGILEQFPDIKKSWKWTDIMAAAPVSL
jgi:hypothetical protein